MHFPYLCKTFGSGKKPQLVSVSVYILQNMHNSSLLFNGVIS